MKISKYMREIFFVAAFLSAIVGVHSWADEGDGPSVEGSKPLMVRQEFSKWTPFKFNLWGRNVAVPKRDSVYGLNLGLWGTFSTKVYGVQAAPLGSVSYKAIGLQTGLYAASTRMAGIQIAGFTNLDYLLVGGEERKTYGLQIHGFGWSDMLVGGQIGGINTAGKGKWAQIGGFNSATLFDGVQLGGLNLDHSYRGVQVGVMNWVTAFDPDVPQPVGVAGTQLGIFNRCHGKLRGTQVGLGNFIFTTDKQAGIPASGSGFQLGGTNFADEFKGVQIGFLNFCRTLKGVQIGIVNAIWNENIKRILPLINASF
ncbi:MAG: hypothetical protein IPN90_02505 [Elusimicrobia bacterium]|nr:hypothetical protein [Elusimicrobiota bacterium]